MSDSDLRPVSIDDAMRALTFQSDRAPGGASADAFARLADYREGGIFIGHWAGRSEWERHAVADEIVMVLAGETTMFFLLPNGEESRRLGAGDLVVVPQNTWHRFETPVGVKVLSVTPQPTDHRTDRPD